MNLRLPRVKPPHRPVRINPETLWLGSPQFGLGVEVKDPDGWIWSTCEAMDGNRTVDGVIAAVRRDHAAVDESTVRQIASFLIQRGWVEEADDVSPDALSVDELERYRRNRDYFAWVDDTPRSDPSATQVILKSKRVTILGVGGIGSAAAMSLAATGVGAVHLVDGDVVETSNLNRQLLYRVEDVGLKKVDVAARVLSQLNPHVRITSSDAFPSDDDAIRAEVTGSDIFIHSADFPRDLPFVSNRVAFAERIPWVIAAYAGPMLTASVWIPGQTACFECASSQAAGEVSASGRGPLLAVPRTEGFNPVIAPTAQMAGHQAALEAIYVLLGRGSAIAGRLYHRSFIDPTNSYQFESRAHPRLHQLRCVALNMDYTTLRVRDLDFKQDGDSWIVGCAAIDRFIALPQVGVAFIEALAAGETADVAQQKVLREFGVDVNGKKFVDQLIALGFIADAGPDEAEPERVTSHLPWLSTARCAWVLSPVTAVSYLAVVCVAFAVLLSPRGLPAPSFSWYFVTDWPGVNVGINTLLFGLALVIHELSHFVNARAVGVTARFSLGVRLHMLAAETKVNGLWMHDRKTRLRVFVAGIAADVLVLSLAVICASLLESDSLVASLCRALILCVLTAVLLQFSVYVRTDLYFAMQELLGCKNLYADAWHLVRRRFRMRGDARWTALPASERRSIKWYSVFMLLASLVTLGRMLLIGYPILITLLARSSVNVWHGLTGTGSAVGVLDGLIAIAVEGGLQVVYFRTLYRRVLKPRMSRFLARTP